MVIIGNKSGQLANRLFVFAHFVANAVEYGYQVANPSFYDYAPFFANIRDDFFCRYPSQKSGLKSSKALQGYYFKLLTFSVSLRKKLGLAGTGLFEIPKDFQGDYQLSCDEFVRKREATERLVVRGWTFRDIPNLTRHADEVRRFFAPVEPHAGNVARLMERARTGCDLLVGVHIRQGDYRSWQGGRYFYQTAQYAEVMRGFAAQHPDKKVRFLVCSNARQDETLFRDVDYLMGNDHPLEDLYSFARCDLLIGPPSTYTAWASFYGSVPLFFVRDPQAPIPADGFRTSCG